MIHKAAIEPFVTHEYETELCIVGGGVSGIAAAVSAARHGTKVILMQDRPMLGGNASSEIRMWIRGATRNGFDTNLRETGIMEELALENIYRNPQMNFNIWDSVMYGIVAFEPNITLILNCSCLDASMKDGRIESITGWQLTTQTYHHVKARIFADCSGDSILAPLTGAEWRMGREGTDEFNESIAPAISDNRTMGMSCLLQAKETSHPVKYIAPSWAYHYTAADFEHKINFSTPQKWQDDNYWWIELGGLVDSIADTETMRDELIKTVYGVWDFIKNGGILDAANWDIDWIGFLPGKRESRRYVGDHILTQNDVEAEGRFPDNVAYGGWTMDDHNPAGFLTTDPPTTWHPAPQPYGIPYRCLYSKNIENLMFAGRNISATHSAMSSTRVMATCGILGQAMGTAASIALRENVSPRGVYEHHIDELQQTLLADDCYIPWITHRMSDLTASAVITGEGDVSKLTDGIARHVGTEDHAYTAPLETPITAVWTAPVFVQKLRIILDSDINRETFPKSWESNWKTYPMRCNIRLESPDLFVPKTLLRRFEVYADGELIASVENNYQRLVNIAINREVSEIQIVPLETWGVDEARIYDMELL